MSGARSAATGLVRFGDTEADLRAGEVRKAGHRIVLPEQPLRILVRLLERPGEVVTRDELRRELWPENTFVDFEHGLNSAIKRLRNALGDSADAPQYIETLPRRGYRFIARIDDTAAPAAGSPAGGAETRAGAGNPPGDQTKVHEVRATGLRMTRRVMLAAVVLTSALTLTAWLALSSSRSHSNAPAELPALAPAPAAANLVAVAAFENRTVDPALASLGELAADRIIRAISTVETAEVLPEAIRTGAAANPSRITDDVVAVARHAGAGVAVTGAYYLRSDRLEFQARVLDAHTGQPLYFAPPAVGARQEPAAALEQLEQAVAGAVAIHFDHAFGGLQITSSAPLLDAYLEYRAGAELFDRDYPGAIARLQRALTISPEFLLARLLMVMAYDNLGDRENTAKQMAHIADRADGLTRAERLLVEYLSESLARRPADALRALHEVEKLAPHSWMVNYSIQMEALILNRPNVGIEAFTRLPLHDRWARYNAWRLEALARALHDTGNYERELKEVKRAQAYQPGKLTYAASETRALAALGRLDDITRVIDDSLALPSSAARPIRTPGDVMEYAARELRAHGHRGHSVAVAARAVEWLRGRPAAAESRAQRAALARVLYLSERWDDAYGMFARLSAEDPASIEYAGHLGVIAARRGRPKRALAVSERLRNFTAPDLFGRHTYWRACIASLIGDQQRAVDLLREALGEGQYRGLQIHQSPDLESLRNFAPFLALTEPKP